MAIECPIQKRNVLYLDCKECEDAFECQLLRLSNFQIKENTDETKKYQTQTTLDPDTCNPKSCS